MARTSCVIYLYLCEINISLYKNPVKPFAGNFRHPFAPVRGRCYTVYRTHAKGSSKRHERCRTGQPDGKGGTRMTTAQRREEILALLNQADAPIAAKDLAARFGVSRQVIVQDMAVIRASTPGILSTTRGYVLQQDKDIACTREFKVRHGQEQAAEELNLIVDCGGRVKNISISHRVYGRVTAEMDIRSRQDVNEFVQAINNSHSSVLSSATSGYHYHLIEASSQERLDLIGEQLKKAGFLAPLQPWEKEKHHNI